MMSLALRMCAIHYLTSPTASRATEYLPLLMLNKMITQKVLLMAALVTALNLGDMRSTSSIAAHNGRKLPRSDEHQPTGEPYGVAVECFRTGTDQSELSENADVNYYEIFFPSLFCLKQESARLQQRGERFKKLPKNLTNVAWKFVNTNNNSFGEIFMNEMKNYTSELASLIKEFETFNQFLITAQIASGNIAVDTAPYENLLNRYEAFVTMFEQLYNVTVQYYIILHNSRLVHNLTEQYKVLHDIEVLENAFELHAINYQSTEHFFKNVEKLVEFRSKNRLQETLNTKFTRRLLDLKYWEGVLTEQGKALSKMGDYLKQQRMKSPLDA